MEATRVEGKWSLARVQAVLTDPPQERMNERATNGELRCLYDIPSINGVPLGPIKKLYNKCVDLLEHKKQSLYFLRALSKNQYNQGRYQETAHPLKAESGKLAIQDRAYEVKPLKPGVLVDPQFDVLNDHYRAYYEEAERAFNALKTHQGQEYEFVGGKKSLKSEIWSCIVNRRGDLPFRTWDQVSRAFNINPLAYWSLSKDEFESLWVTQAFIDRTKKTVDFDFVWPFIERIIDTSASVGLGNLKMRLEAHEKYDIVEKYGDLEAEKRIQVYAVILCYRFKMGKLGHCHYKILETLSTFVPSDTLAKKDLLCEALRTAWQDGDLNSLDAIGIEKDKIQVRNQNKKRSTE